jgi:hypothetical protein
MNRMKRFGENAGIRGILLVIALIFIFVQDLRSGLWSYTVPLFVLMFLVTYPFRGWLVKHLGGVRTVMNSLAIVAIIASVIFRGSAFSESLWFAIVVVGFVGAYLGCYFWLLSDERVAPVR